MPRFTPDFLDELRSRLRASDVIGRHVKLKKEGREYRGLSPFTNEKTPSFFVNDQKARYFDFSSGRSGDIIGFTMDTQKLSFVEAVTRLAEQAGMDIPEDTPEQAAKAEEAKGLAQACTAAAKYFVECLSRIEGREARDYLDMRQVPEPLQRRFGIGYAPDSKTALKDYLINKGFSVDLLVEAGLLIRLEDGTSYDRFRHRLMFPILSAGNKVIAFGGRALRPGEKAKYLNSPETPLFHKSHVLYNYARARKAAAQLPEETGQALIVCEGYMDVIGIARAGFGHAVAPLGTALTEAQLKMLWRVCDEPVLCFDGDRAGQKAAFRAIDRALPILTPGKSLNFAFLPEGQDPDDLVKNQGANAFAKILEQAKPLADVIWERELEAHPMTTPEKRAAFRKELRQLVKTIPDPDVRLAYGNWLREKLDGLYASKDKNNFQTGAYRKNAGLAGKSGPFAVPTQASSALKAHKATNNGQASIEREALMVLCLLNHPGLFDLQEEAIMALELASPKLAKILAIMAQKLAENPDLDAAAIQRHISTVEDCAGTLEALTRNGRLKINKFAGAEATLEEAQAGWLNVLSLHLHHGLLRTEEAEAASEAFLDEHSETRWRVAHSHRQAVLANGKLNDGQTITPETE
ncbi:MAG: DNA primase [bacterium]